MADPTFFAVSYEDRDYSTGARRNTTADVTVSFKVNSGDQLQYSGLETFGISTTRPFRGRLVGGVLQKVGGGSLQLVANVNLDLDALVYTIRFTNAKVDGVPVQINSFDFEAQTSSTALNLNTVSPVVGQFTTGYTRGPQGPQGVPGPQGPPGEVTNAAMNAALATKIPITGRGNSVVFMGDSITEGGCVPRATAANSIVLGGLVAQVLARVPALRYRFNAGVGGDDTNEMIARWTADVVNQSPTVLHLLGGTNDVTGGISDVTTIANLRWMIREAKKIGCTVFIGTIPPRDESDSVLDNIERINVAIKTLAANEGVHLIDYHAALVDPPNGHYQAGLTTDGIHPNPAGYKVMATLAAAVMNRVLPQGSLPVGVSQFSGTQNRLGFNCCFLTDSNSDGMPDSWSAGGTATTSTFSLVSDPDFIGNALQHVFTGANQRYAVSLITSDKFAVGQTIAFCGKYKASVESGGGAFRIQVLFNNSSDPNYTKLRPVGDLTVDTDGVGYFYIEGVIPAGTNRLDVMFQATSGAGTIKLGQPALWVLGSDGIPV